MIKKFFGLLFLSSILFAEVTNIPVSVNFIEEKKMKIIDIRTKGEWMQMGIIKDAYLLTFFDEQYNYNGEKFLEELNKIIEKNEEFAIICNTASRTQQVSNFLGKKHNYKVVNLTGGMMQLRKEGFNVEFYDPHIKREIKKEVVKEKIVVVKSIVADPKFVAPLSFMSSVPTSSTEELNCTEPIKE